MVHGAPDNFEVQQKGISYRLDDMAELAIRLGHSVSLDRLGEIIFYDNFNDGSGIWATAFGGIGGNANISGNLHRTGGFSYKVISGINNYGQIYAYLFYPIISKLGFEFWYSDNVFTDYVLFRIYIYNGITTYKVDVKIDRTNKKIYIYDSTGAYIEIEDSLKLSNSPNIFHGYKVVIDVENVKFVRLKTWYDTYDLSNYNLYDYGASRNKEIDIRLINYGIIAQQSIVYWDDIIITQNEP